MKAITLTQPWATLVAIGAKKIETRSWRTKHEGLLAIHAASTMPWEAKKALINCAPIREALKASDVQDSLPGGCVVAVARLMVCGRIFEDRTLNVLGYKKYFVGPNLEILSTDIPAQTIPPDEPELSFGDYMPGRYAWVLRDVIALPIPVMAKGALGLWDWDEPPGLREWLAERGIPVGEGELK